MYLLYVDESGDVGLKNSPTKYFCLSGLVMHELRWEETLTAIVNFRKSIRVKYGLKLREEIHAAHFINKPGEIQRIPKSMRLHLLRDVIDFQSSLQDISIINVVVDKTNKPDTTDIFNMAWETLVQRFHNTLSHKNFPGPQNTDDRGMIVADRTDEIKLRGITRKMRRFNFVPSMFGGASLSRPTSMVINNAIHRDSKHSFFIQLCDVNAYFLFQYFEANGYIRKKGAKNYILKLGSALCLSASKSNPFGIVIR